jgi:hypothetical protein
MTRGGIPKKGLNMKLGGKCLAGTPTSRWEQYVRRRRWEGSEKDELCEDRNE